jgi:hypothetical protein
LDAKQIISIQITNAEFACSMERVVDLLDELDSFLNGRFPRQRGPALRGMLTLSIVPSSLRAAR